MTQPQPFDLHAAYAGMMLLGMALTLSFPLTKHFSDSRDKHRYYAIQLATALCALAGAKFSVVLGDALWPLEPFDDWHALLGSGRSIVGALLFGFLGAEAAKPLLRYDIPPNDRFAVIVPFSIAVGRIGCLIVGCCRGIPYDGPFAITYDDGIPRHPAPVYEMLFNFAMGFVLIALWRRQILFGRLFALYLACYGVFRFLVEFVRDTAKPYGGLSAYQLMSIAMVVAGAVALAARSGNEPASWKRWRAVEKGV